MNTNTRSTIAANVLRAGVAVLALAGAGAVVAAPPHWAPAYGWHAQHGGYAQPAYHYHEHHHYYHRPAPHRARAYYGAPGYRGYAHHAPGYGYATGPAYGRADYCRNGLGSAMGGALGGFLGSKVGKGSGQLAATAAGTLGGFLVGRDLSCR